MLKIVPKTKKKTQSWRLYSRDGWITQLIFKGQILITILQALETLVQVLDPDDEVGDEVDELVEEECDGNEEDVALIMDF